MSKVNVKMLEAAKGSEDGIHTKEYKKGEIYSIEKRLADVFIGKDMKVAELSKHAPKKAEAKKEEKVIKDDKEVKGNK